MDKGETTLLQERAADRAYMQLALREARAAASLGEVPVGAVLVRDGMVLAAAHNRRELDGNALAHAELLALDAGCRKLGGWRLERCTLYVTLEPCPMCTGAIINARVARVVFGAQDPKAGCLGSITDLSAMPFNHRPEVLGGVAAEPCGAVLRAFFRELRERKG